MSSDHRAASTRLVLEPLTLAQCTVFLLGVRDGQPWASDFPTDGDLRQAHLVTANHARAVSEHNPWGPYTLVEQRTGLAIGGVGFKGVPDAAGEVEIGYGICRSRQNQGLMTEALRQLCELARVKGARVLTAETDPSNRASQRVLEKNGFIRATEQRGSIWWRRELTSPNDLTR